MVDNGSVYDNFNNTYNNNKKYDNSHDDEDANDDVALKRSCRPVAPFTNMV